MGVAIPLCDPAPHSLGPTPRVPTHFRQQTHSLQVQQTGG